MRIIFDASAIKSSRRIDDNGFLHVAACPITSFGVFDYARVEAELPGDPNEIVKVLRQQETVSSADFIASCQNLPIIDDHTYIEGVVTDSAGEEAGMDPDKKGVCGAMTNVRFDEESGWVVADLVFYSRSMIRQITADKKVELSLGYTCKFLPCEGQAYSAEQVDMTGNHLALVDRARVPGARVLDSAFSNQSLEDVQMPKPTKVKALDSSSVEKLREVLLPALQQFLSEESQEPEHQEQPQQPAAVDDDELTDEERAATEAEAGAVAAEQGEEPAVEAEQGEGDIVSALKALLGALSGAAGDEAPDENGENGPDDEQTVGGDEDDNEEQVAAKPAAVSMDAMFAAVAKRDALYARVSKVVGAFDHAAMSHDKLAKYSVKKLGIKCGDGAELIAIDAYLNGVEAAGKAAISAEKSTKKVGDSMPSSSELDAYLAGK